MIEELFKILILEKMAASQKKVAAYLKKGWNYYQILNPSIITWQIYIRSRLKISSRTAQPFKESFRTDSEKSVSRKNAFKVLRTDYTKLKNSQKYDHISETFYQINFNFRGIFWNIYTFDICICNKKIYIYAYIAKAAFKSKNMFFFV